MRAQRTGTGFPKHPWGTLGDSLRDPLAMGTVQGKEGCPDDAQVSHEASGNSATEEEGSNDLVIICALLPSLLPPQANGRPPLLLSQDSALSTRHCNPFLKCLSPALYCECLGAGAGPDSSSYLQWLAHDVLLCDYA